MNSKHKQNKDNNSNFICILDNNDPSLYDLGILSLKGNNFGVVILAGGQGSRLGSDLPKALFKLNGKPLIEYHIERIIKIQEEYGCSITLFIMVSSFTEKEIKDYLKNNNFNLKIEIIKQEDRECVGVKGRDDKNEDKVKEEDNKEYINNNNNTSPLKAPGGNGDVFKSLSNLNLNSFIGINVISVDNVLAKVLDPVFVGGFIKNNLEILSKAVKKRENENVGVFLVKSEGLRIREYNDSKVVGVGEGKVGEGSKVVEGKVDEGKVGNKDNLHHPTTNPTNPYPTPNPPSNLYGNICNHLFSPSFIKKMSKIPLKEHSVLKKIPFLKNGQWVKPPEPNGFKIETFIFDCFEYATRNGFLKVKREEEFAPLKNGNESKEDNPRTCEEALGRGEGIRGVVR